jgi:hypothetical protein
MFLLLFILLKKVEASSATSKEKGPFGPVLLLHLQMEKLL